MCSAFPSSVCFSVLWCWLVRSSDILLLLLPLPSMVEEGGNCASEVEHVDEEGSCATELKHRLEVHFLA